MLRFWRFLGQRHQSRASIAKRSRKRSYHPRVEVLEQRCVPAAATFNEFVIPTASSSPEGLVLGSDGNLAFTESTGNNIGRITGTGNISEVVIPTANSVPTEIASGPDGNLWFTENNANNIGQITPSGTITELPITTAASGPSGITAGPDGNLWFTEFNTGKIGKITTAGAVTEFPLPSAGSQPEIITTGSDGNLWFTELAANRIGRITPAGKITEFALPTLSGNPNPFGIVGGPDSALWFTEAGSSKIGRITTSGVVKEFTLPTANASPHGITVGADNNLYFAESNANQIGRISVTGTITEFPIPTASSDPTDVAMGPNGNIWFNEFNANKIGEMTISHFIVTGAGAGGGPEVKVVDSLTGATVMDFYAYDPRFLGGVRVTTGDVDKDGDLDIITAPGPGGGPDIRVFDGSTGLKIMEFMAYDSRFQGGVNVAVGDVNGDGFGDIITGADAGGGPEVKVFSGKNQAVLQDFYAFGAKFSGGVRVASADFNADGRADIVTGAGPGGGPEVKVFDGKTLGVLQDFFAFTISFSGGVYVAAGDVNGDSVPDVIAGEGSGGQPLVNVFSGVDGSMIRSFLAYDSRFRGGVRVGALDFNGDGITDIITGAGPGGGPQVEVFNGTTLGVLDSFYAYSPAFAGGVYVGGH